jgi:hypothetical protein
MSPLALRPGTGWLLPLLAAWLIAGCPTPQPHDDDRDDDSGDDDSGDDDSGDDDTVGDDDTADDDSVDDDTTAPPATSLYGCAWNADNLDNVELGPEIGRRISYRFRAEQNGDVTEAMVFLVFAGPGYYAGTGGQVLLELQTDDGGADHLPSGTVLTSSLVTDPTLQWNRLFAFAGPASLQAGELYHLVFSNPDPDPATNWVSTDCLYMEVNAPDMQPAVSDVDLATLVRHDAGSPWAVSYKNTPIFSLHYSDGHKQGQAYVDVWYGAAPGDVYGPNMIRQVMTVSGGDRQVQDVSVRIKRVDGSGDLTITLEDAGEQPIEVATVAEATFGSDYQWVTMPFAALQTLADGQTYHLVLSAPSSAQYHTYPLQEGGFYGFEASNTFADGHYQYTDGGDWGMIYGDRTDFDMQFYFTVLEP